SAHRSGHMEGRSGRDLDETARGDRRRTFRRGALSRGDRDAHESVLDGVLLDELPHAPLEFAHRRGRLDPQDLEALPQPREVRLESERRAAVDADRLEAAVAIEVAAVPDRDAGLVLGDDGAVN